MQRTIMMLMSFILGISLWSSMPVASAATVSFYIQSNEEEVQSGDEIEVEIRAAGVQDLYGYEIALDYDTDKLRYKKATSGISTLIYPIDTAAEHTMLLVSTKLGDAKGSNGEVLLSTITFEATGSGTADIRLKSVKTATSSANAATHEVGKRIQVQVLDPNDTNEEPAVPPVDPTPEPDFTDITGHWSEAGIKRAVELGFIQGYGDGTFRPNREVSRAEFAVMIYGAMGYTESSAALQRFQDLDRIAAWSRPAISALAAEGIISGYEDGTFRPGQSILRSEVAIMMAAIMELDVDPAGRSTFADAAKMKRWAEPAIAAVAEQGLLQGRGNNLFMPDALLTRAEAVQVILSMIDQMNRP